MSLKNTVLFNLPIFVDVYKGVIINALVTAYNLADIKDICKICTKIKSLHYVCFASILLIITVYPGSNIMY